MRHVLTQQTILSKCTPKAKACRYSDGGGLYLEVTPSGSRYWRMKYYFEGKEKRLALRVYPRVSLKEARSRRDEARLLLDRSIDPNAAKAARKAAVRAVDENSFEVVAREWYAKKRPAWVESHASKVIGRLQSHVFPHLGSTAVGEVTSAQLLACLMRIEAKSYVETAHRALNICSRIFVYAIAQQRARTNPALGLGEALSAVSVRHHASITEPQQIGKLLIAIDGYKGKGDLTKLALKLAPLVFVRPGELRKAEWDEIDVAAAQWTIPSRRMKKRLPHIVPLSRQALAIFEELRLLSGHRKLVFPGVRSPLRPMSENTMNAALRYIGYSRDDMTSHGFRSLASTRLNELGYEPDVIERQLAHVEGNSVRAAYNYAEYMPARRTMMQAWSDYLDGLRATAKGKP